MSEKKYCADCFYDLKNLSSNQCPECGKRFLPDDMSTFEVTTEKPIQPLHFYLGGGFVLLMLLWAGITSGKLMMYVDVPSVLIVAGFCFGGLWMSSGIVQPCRALWSVLAGKRIYDFYEYDMCCNVMERGRNLAWAGGMIGMLIGMISMLADLSDPHGIGAGLAVALLCPLYAAILGELVFAQCGRFLASRNRHMLKQNSKREGSLAKHAAVVILFAVVNISVLMLSFGAM